MALSVVVLVVVVVALVEVAMAACGLLLPWLRTCLLRAVASVSVLVLTGGNETLRNLPHRVRAALRSLHHPVPIVWRRSCMPPCWFWYWCWFLRGLGGVLGGWNAVTGAVLMRAGGP